MDAVQRLTEIEAIKNLMARRVRTLDAGDWEAYRACHAPEHISYLPNGDPGNGREVMMKSVMKSLEGVRTIHQVHSPHIEILSPTEARGFWALEDWLFWMQGDEEHWLHGWGWYDDTYAKRDGEWVFTSRRLSRQREEHSPGSNRANK